ncbi:MAG: sulfite exporter TauE/SafE family protein [Betaproteobacteria bacterium]
MTGRVAALLWLLKVGGASLAGGVVGSISGLGGGIVIVPVLTLFLGVPIQDAVAASIVSVIAVSSGAGSVYVKDRITNIRIAMFLELSTAAGALFGAAVLTRWVNPQMLSILFGSILLISLIPVVARIGEELPRGVENDRLAAYLRLNGSYFDKRLNREVVYNVTGIPAAIGLMGLAGIISGLLGIGAGVVKVLAHEIAMRVPSKVSTATSNFMIGVTAAAAAGVYLKRGLVLPFLVVPVAVAVLAGAFLGTVLMERMSNAHVRQVFAAALAVIGVEMLLRGFGVRF